MGADQSKPKRKLEEIEREVRIIRSDLRASNRSYSKERKSNIQENLVRYSNQASELKGKVKNKQLDSIQKNISLTMKEVLTMDSVLDKAAVETDSIVQVSEHRLTSSLDRPKTGLKMKSQSKSMPSLTNCPNLQDIDNKLKTLKSQIKVALQSEDTTQLRFFQQTLKVLATSLELIDVPEYTPIGDKKNKLEKTITSQYQTINRSLREIKRNRDITYLANLKQKDEVTKELEIIRRELEKYDSLSREAVKAGDNSTVRDVQHNLIQLKQRINSVGSIDETTKTMKLQMKDKISWLTKVILESSQKGSQPDLSKAQAEYEDIIKNIASGRHKSEKEWKEKLETLQSFTNSINNVSDENVKRKRQLLTNINESLTTLNSNEINSGTSTVDIGSQESDLRKILSDFANIWRELETALKNSSFSDGFSQQVNIVLRDIHHSIGETRKSLKNEQKKVENYISVSVPNIAEINIRNKEKTNTFNEKSEGLPLPLMDSMLVPYLNTGKTRQEETRFSRINEIKTQVYYIKEKFESSIQKPNLKTKLEDYIRTLEDYTKSDNEVIANNARILMTDIYDIIKNIDLSLSKNAEVLPLGYYIDIISRMEDNVAKLERTAKNFQADRNDTGYQDTKKLLTETKEYLETFDIPLEYENAISKRGQILKKTGQIIDQCEREYLKREEAYVKGVKKNLEMLGDKIDRFNGPYKGVIYNAIEKDLNKILIDADANITNKFTLEEIIKKTEKYLKIIENRAIKDQNIGQPRKQEHNQKMSALKEELQSIKNDMDNTPINAIDIFIGLNSRLDLIKLSLDQLKNLDENTEHQKEIIYNEIETLKNVVEAKIALGQQDINQNSLEEFKKKATEENDRRVNEELDKIELTFLKLKEDIRNFIGTKSDKKYYELDESTMRLIVKMDDLKLAKGTQLYDRKVELLKQIHKYEHFLEKRTQETEYVIQIERDVTDIELSFPIFEKTAKDLDNLIARLKTLKLNLEGSKCSTPVQGRKTSCIQKINDLEANIQTKINEKILIDESLLQVKYNLELIGKNAQGNDVSLDDLTNKLYSIKTTLHEMENLNTIHLQQRVILLQELEKLDKNLTSMKSNTNKSSGNTSFSEPEGTRNKTEKDLMAMEQTMNRLKNEIQIFIGTTKDHRFCEIDEHVNKLIMTLDDMKFGNDSSFPDKKVKLLRELNHYSELLKRRAEENEQILHFERELGKVGGNPSNFSDEHISDIIKKFEKLEVGNDFMERKIISIKKFNEILNKRNEEMIEYNFLIYEKDIEDLWENIDRFSGISSDTSFVEIEKKLQKLLIDVQTIKILSNTESDQRKNKVLEQIRSSIHFLTNKANENQIFRDFMKQLDDIKNQINITTNRDVMTKMLNRLKFIQSDAERSSIKEKLKNDIQRQCTLLLQSYSEKIGSLPNTNYIGSEGFLKDLENNKVPNRKSPSTSFVQQFESLEQKIIEIEASVQEFLGNENSPDYKKLEDELLRINIQVKKLNDLNNSENTTKKLELKGRVVNCLTMLDEKIQDFENVEEIETELDLLTGKLHGNLNEQDRDEIDEKLISLQLRLGKFNHPNKRISERKNASFQKILNFTKFMKQHSSNSNTEEDSGTSI